MDLFEIIQYIMNLHKTARNIEPGGNIFLRESPDIPKATVRHALTWVCFVVSAQWDIPDIAL